MSTFQPSEPSIESYSQRDYVIFYPSMLNNLMVLLNQFAFDDTEVFERYIHFPYSSEIGTGLRYFIELLKQFDPNKKLFIKLPDSTSTYGITRYHFTPRANITAIELDDFIEISLKHSIAFKLQEISDPELGDMDSNSNYLSIGQFISILESINQSILQQLDDLNLNLQKPIKLAEEINLNWETEEGEEEPIFTLILVSPNTRGRLDLQTPNES